ncbi:hypothetical protein V8E36_008524 [Tilletia maclaganii]
MAQHRNGSSSSSSSSEESDGSFTTLIGRVAQAAAQLASAPPTSSSSSTSTGQQQDPAALVLHEVQRLTALADSLSLISPNEELRDISTPSLRALFLPSLTAEILTRQRTPPAAAPSSDPSSMFDARKKVLREAVNQARSFLATVTRLNVLPTSTVSLLGARNELLNAAAASSSNSSSSAEATFLPSSSVSASAAQSRQLKISLFKLERSLAASLDAYRQQARANAATRRAGVRAPAQGLSSSSGAATLESAPEEAVYDLLVLGTGDNDHSEERDDDNDLDEENGRDVGSSNSSTSTANIPTPTSLRSYLLLNLNLHALKTYALLESATQELTLLANMPPPPSQAAHARDARAQGHAGGPPATDSTWKLDTPLGGGLTSGPLLDPKGRPLRPFTITGSTSTNTAAVQLQDPSSKREAMRAQVFQPSHRLPTMSIDNYLAEEERRGNVLRGGGQQGAAKATPKEERAIRAELDGTRQGEEAAEEERQEAIRWDRWADEHRRGEGNTMNRG